MNNRCRPPEDTELSMFYTVTNNPVPGKNRTILVFNGKSIKATAFGYSRLWGLYVSATAPETELKIIEEIKRKINPDPPRLKRFIDFANCPPLNISFDQWMESAVEAAQKILRQLADSQENQDTSLILLSEVRSWGTPLRILKFYSMLGIKPENPQKNDYSIPMGKQNNNLLHRPAVDSDYYIYGITKEDDGFKVIEKPIFQKGQPLCFTKDSIQNKSQWVTVAPFAPNSRQIDLILGRKDAGKIANASICRLSNRESRLKFSIQFEPLEETPVFNIPGETEPLIIKNIPLLPEISIIKEPKLLQVVTLIDATLPENLLQAAKERLKKVFGSISAEHPTVQLGLVVYGDYSEGGNRVCEFDVKPIPPRFITINEWNQVCDKEIINVKSLDFMSALDRGLNHALQFPWDEKAEKFFIIIFCNPPHPLHEPPRDIYRYSSFKHAQEDWYKLLHVFRDQRKIKLFPICQKKIRQNKNQKWDIDREVDIICDEIRKIAPLGMGIENLDEIEVGILKYKGVNHRIEPELYQIPIILEN